MLPSVLSVPHSIPSNAKLKYEEDKAVQPRLFLLARSLEPEGHLVPVPTCAVGGEGNLAAQCCPGELET